jgi:hypothetical protein
MYKRWIKLTEEDKDLSLSQNYPYSVKYTDTSEGVRITVHVYGFDGKQVVKELNALYEEIRGEKPVFAPMVKAVKEKEGLKK